MQDPREGLRIGRYTLVRRLGTGGMGSVWEAVLHGPEGFQKHVALKLLLPANHGGAESDRRSLIREARIGALLQHPNVVGTHDLGEVDGRWYVAMELVRGASFAEALDGGPLPGPALVEAALQVCAGLAHIHGLEVDGKPAGLVHRDLKPSNLLLDRSGLVKIADLGIARLQAAGAGASGTPGYLSEEQSLGREDQRSDVFSFGVTLFELATGRLPFGTGVQALYKLTLVEQSLEQGLCRPVDDAVPGLGAIVRRCLRRDPADRFPDAHTLGEVLAELRATQSDGLSLATVLARTRPDLLPETQAAVRRPAPEARTMALAPGNLPPQADPFFGRSAEITAIGDRIRAHDRLLLLKGPGGTGKTRLALAVARELATDLPGGSWFVDLSEAVSAAGMCSAVATALQVGLDRHDPIRQLGRAFAYRGRALFVLDNLEQVVDAVPETVSRWLELAPEATFLCTSRVALRVSGERVIPVDPLPVDAGVELFLERSPRPPGPSERPAVARLVEALEGLPLAIELAAARTRLMPVARIQERLVDRLRLLADGDRDRPSRQRSLTASLDASWDLLPPWGRDALGQLAVFDGGCTLEAAEAVVDVSTHPDAPWGVDVLAELVDASLLRTEPSGDRFRMLVVVQEWAKARATPALLAAAEQRHGAWCARNGTEAALEALSRSGGLERRLLLLPELDNLVAACRRAIARGDVATAALTGAAVGDLLVVRGPLATLIELTTAVLALPGLTMTSERRTWSLLATAYTNVGRIADAAVAQERALDLALREPNPRAAASLYGRVGWRLQLEGKVDLALAACHQSMAMAERHPSPDVRLAALSETGGVHWLAGRLSEARAAFEEAIPLARRLGDFRTEAFCTGNLGLVLSYLGEREAAMDQLQRAQEALASIGDQRNQALLCVNMGLVFQESGRLAPARVQYTRAVEILGRVGDERGRATALCNLGYALHEQGETTAARQYLEESLAISQRVSEAQAEVLAMSNLGVVAWDQGFLADAERHWNEAADRAVKTSQHRILLIVAVQLAYFAIDQRELAAARGHLATATAAVQQSDSDRQPWVDGCLARVALLEGDATALRALEASVAALREARDMLGLALQVHLATEVARAGDDARGLALVDEVESALRAGGYCGALGEALVHRGGIHQLAGRHALAEADFAAARGLFDRAGFTSDAPLRRELAALGAKSRH